MYNNKTNIVTSAQISSDEIQNKSSQDFKDVNKKTESFVEDKYEIPIDNQINTFSVDNTFLIAQKRTMQNKIAQAAHKMNIRQEDIKKISSLSYLSYLQLQEKIKRKAQEEDSPYGIDLEKQEIENFVREQQDKYLGYSVENNKKNNSQKNKKNGTIARSPKSQNKKKKGNGGKIAGGLAALGSLYWVGFA